VVILTEVTDLSPLTLSQQLRYWAAKSPNTDALRQKEYGIWAPITWAEYERCARHFGMGLLSLGVVPGAHCAILSENRKEWVFSQLGANSIGCVVVGLYPTSPAPEIEYLIAVADVEVIVCEDQEQIDKVLEVREKLPQLKHLIVIDPRGLRNYTVPSLMTFDDIIALGKSREAQLNPKVSELVDRQSMNDIALIIFTSGSTGRPKAAMISYGNIASMAAGTDSSYQCSPRDSTVSYLPLCHAAEQIYTVFLPLRSGMVVNFAESLRTIQSDLREIGPTLFLGVPRIWEKMHASITISLRETGGLRAYLADRALAVTLPLVDQPRDEWSLIERVKFTFWYYLLLRSLTNFLGLRECRHALSGAAPISAELLRFFRAIGVPIREGYGMTETSGLIAVQRDLRSPVGVVGAAIPGVEITLGDDGELLVRGGPVFQGYYRNDAATREMIDSNGWLHTGDLARMVGGEIKIVDRKKDIMITAGGKNITPSEVENMIKTSPYIKEVIVIADGRPFVSALVQIDYPYVSVWADEKGIAFTNYRNLAENDHVRNLVQSEVDIANARMPQVQQVRKFHILTKELDHDDGEVTATLKVKRKAIFAKYEDLIESLYGSKQVVVGSQ